ncbi:MAG: glycosyltransferase [Chitinophagaceae bacterium]|nr:glycosyltransferase [Chitinophagaceae bacterium]
MESVQNTYTQLLTPQPIRKHQWPRGTQALVHVRTMVYNHEKYLRTCLDSILMQETTFPVRLIIHDDASTDQSVAILKEYEERFPNIVQVFYQTENTYQIKNKKEFLLKRDAFNQLRNAPYEAICEGDDYWTDPLKLQLQAEFLESHTDYAAVVHATQVHNEDGRVAKETDFWIQLEGDSDLTLSDIVQPKVPFHTSSFFFRSKVIPRIIHFPIKPKSGDWLTFSMVALEGKIRYIHRNMSVYRTHNSGITMQEDHWHSLEVALNRYTMWQLLKTYAYNDSQRMVFNKMLHYQRKYLIEQYKTKNWKAWLQIANVILQFDDWRSFVKHLRRGFNLF